MKLLLITLVMGFVFLMEGSEKKGNMETKEKAVEEQVLFQIKSDASISEISVEENWLKVYVWMMKVLNPVKQLDLPNDNGKNWNNLSYRILHSELTPEHTQQGGGSFISQFICLLSARHSNGFYIYSLEKLIL